MAESLIVFAWVNTVPHLLLKEIQKAMKKLGITEQYFTFKTMTPVYPDLLVRLQEKDYYEKLEGEFTHAVALKLEKERI